MQKKLPKIYCFVDEFNAVGDHQLWSWIFIGVATDHPQMLFSELDHCIVDFNLHHGLDGFVLEHFLKHATVAATND